MDAVTVAALLANSITALVNAWSQLSQGKLTPEQAAAYLTQAHADVATSIAQFNTVLAAKSVKLASETVPAQ